MDGELSRADVCRCLAALRSTAVQEAFTTEQKKSISKLCRWLSALPDRPGGPTDLSKSNIPAAWPADELEKAPQNGDGPRSSSPSSTAEGRAAVELDSELAAELHKVHSWDTFDVFKVRALSGGRVLEVVALVVFKRLELLSHFNLDLTKLTNFLQSVEAAYNDNPYHNGTHAADVVQSLSVLLTVDQLHSKLSQLEVLAVVLAAIVHDVGHPGVTNDFLVKSRAEQALVYNDNSPNENMHVARAFEILARPGHNFLDTLACEQYRVVRRLVIEIVLATDMAGHSCVLANFQAGKSSLGSDIALWPVAFRKYVLMMLMHCADIGNPAKPLSVSLQWTERIVQESWMQGERERALGLAVSPLCNQESVHIPTMQQHFLERFVQPTFLAMSDLAPKVTHQALRHIATNIQYWKGIPRTVNAVHHPSACNGRA